MPADPSGAGKPGRSRRWRFWLAAFIAAGAIGVGGWELYRRSVLSSSPAQIAAAEKLLIAGKPGAARHAVSSLLYFSPSHPEALSVLGRSYLLEQRSEAAIGALSQVPQQSSAYRRVGFPLATAYLQLGDLQQAETVLSQFLQRFPQADEVRNELRWLYFNQFRTRDVVRLLEDRLRLHPADQQTLADLLDSEYRQQVPFEGAAYLRKVDQQRPGQALVAAALGHAEWRMGHVEQAQALFRFVAESETTDPRVRFLLVEFLIEQGDLPAAEEILNRQPELRTDDRYWSLRSRIAEQQRDFAAALTNLNQAIELHGMDHKLAGRRVDFLRQLGRKGEIEAAAQAAHELLKCDRELADLVGSRVHHQPVRSSALKLADLCERLGKLFQAEHWRLLAKRLPEGVATP